MCSAECAQRCLSVDLREGSVWVIVSMCSSLSVWGLLGLSVWPQIRPPAHRLALQLPHLPPPPLLSLYPLPWGFVGWHMSPSVPGGFASLRAGGMSHLVPHVGPAMCVIPSPWRRGGLTSLLLRSPPPTPTAPLPLEAFLRLSSLFLQRRQACVCSLVCSLNASVQSSLLSPSCCFPAAELVCWGNFQG